MIDVISGAALPSSLSRPRRRIAVDRRGTHDLRPALPVAIGNEHGDRRAECLARAGDPRHHVLRALEDPLHQRLRHAALGHPEHAALIARVLAIRPRKPSRKTVAWLTEDEADALLAAPDPATWTGRRDRLLMLLMLTSGPRVSEVTALTWGDILLARPGAHVLWHGKGRKERITPLQPPAITGLRQWQRENPADPGAFHPGDEWQRLRVEARPVIDVDVVQAGGFDLDDRLARLRLRPGYVFIPEDLRAAG